MPENGAEPGIFGGLTPQEAGRLSWERRRQREADALAAATDVSHEDVAGIMQALKAKALAGDVAASRELREWLAFSEESDERPADVLSLLTSDQRDVVRGWLAENHE